MTVNRLIAYVAMALLLGGCTSGDSDVAVDKIDYEGVSIEVPVTIEIESAWNIDEEGVTRAAPPGSDEYHGTQTSTTISEGWVNGESDIESVDKVRIVTFRRKDTSDGNGTSEPFVYDVKNDKVLTIIGWKNVDVHDGELPTSHRHRYATGTLKKVFGYEYRVIALAYNSARTVPYSSNTSYNNVLIAGEQNWFDLNIRDGLTLDEFKMTVKTQTVADNSTDWREYLTGNSSATGSQEHMSQLSSKVMAYPQLFWGYCHIGDKEPVIRFQTTNGSGDLVNDAPLTGLLYRGMAKVELHINLEKYRSGLVDYNVDWLSLMGDHMLTDAYLSDYDCFLTPSSPVAEDGKYTSFDFITSASSGTKVMTAWVLPTRTRLAIRGRTVRVGTHHVNNGQLCAGNLSYSDMGTGIISVDVADNYFYFRRNHKYVLNCSSSENVFKNHEID